MSGTASPSIALVTAAVARDLDEDLPPLQAVLLAAGAAVHIVDWDDAGCDWASFDLALLRSPWDYVSRLPQFLSWAEHAAALTTLLNPVPLIRWNTDKHYLAEMAHAGVPIVPSEFIEPDADAPGAIAAFLARHDCHDLVVKPAIGAGSRDAQRHARTQSQAIAAHVQRLIDAGRSALLQPYLERVDEYGETALIYFDGRFSHAIRKGPLLQRGQEPTRELFAAEQISPRVPAADELHVARRALAVVPSGRPLYARVDLIRDVGAAPRVLELEMAEPSLFFAHAAGSAARFAAAILRRVHARTSDANRAGDSA